MRRKHSNHNDQTSGGRDSIRDSRQANPGESRPSFSLEQVVVQISSVEVQKRNAERVNVYVDGKYVFSLSALLAHEYKLRRGAAVSADVLREALRRDEVGKAVDAAVKLLAFRPRSETELTRRLAQKGYDRDIIDEAVGRLREQGFVSDAEFARFWVDNREQFKPMGTRRIRSELIQKGVGKETIDEALQDENPDQQYDLALRAAKRKLRSYSGLEYDAYYRRMGGYLARQGFDYQTSSRVMKELWSESHGDTEVPDDVE